MGFLDSTVDILMVNAIPSLEILGISSFLLWLSTHFQRFDFHSEADQSIAFDHFRMLTNLNSTELEEVDCVGKTYAPKAIADKIRGMLIGFQVNIHLRRDEGLF